MLTSVHSFLSPAPSFTGLRRFIFSPSFIPSPFWSPLMKDGLDTMLVLSFLECECLVCLFQVPASAADPWSLTLQETLTQSRTWGMVLRIIVSGSCCCGFPSFSWCLLLKMSVGKEGDSCFRKLVTYRVSLGPHPALQWMEDSLPSFVIPSTPWGDPSDKDQKEPTVLLTPDSPKLLASPSVRMLSIKDGNVLTETCFLLVLFLQIVKAFTWCQNQVVQNAVEWDEVIFPIRVFRQSISPIWRQQKFPGPYITFHVHTSKCTNIHIHIHILCLLLLFTQMISQEYLKQRTYV